MKISTVSAQVVPAPTTARKEIVVYQPDETIRLDVRLENETVWLNRQQLAVLFGRDIKTIGKHIANALSEELAVPVVALQTGTTARHHDPAIVGSSTTAMTTNPTVAKFATVQNEGSRQVVRQVEFYGLDVILSVGYRVKSPQGIL